MTTPTHTLVAADADALALALPIEAGAVRSRRLFKGSGASVVRLSLDEGQLMREHTASAPILVQVLSGHVILEVDGERIDLRDGGIIHIEAGIPHSVEAVTAAHLTLILAERTAQPSAHLHAADAAPATPDARRLLPLREAASACECGVVDEPELPELDVRSVPHSIRHATVFGALDAAADGLILVAPHNPLPLLDQIERRNPGRFAVDYLDEGPDAWRIRLSPAPAA